MKVLGRANLAHIPERDFRIILEQIIRELGYVVEVVERQELDGRNLPYTETYYRLNRPTGYQGEPG